ncbi:MAG: hypothetical protein A2045_09495 [Rhodocyclales bacterium GWA2_65_20]|nr:MAG: hypothetical protein A2045_09495 [Rhodocyclales bacterium GWA2_65_20]
MIEAALLAKVMGQVSSRPQIADDELVRHLRATFPGVHFSVCSDDDMPPKLPAAAGNDYCRLYYVDSGDHCLKLTTDAAAATGLVVALCDQDEP